MHVSKALSGCLLPAAVVLVPLLPAAAPASAAETAEVVSGPPSTPGGVSTATCRPGTHLTGGGYRLQPDADGPVRASGPTADATGWSAQAERGSVVAFAVCETED
ncbi:hypothetical protein ACFQ6N_30620 [Kitasatospora sp. NPDC056446]|uniref:hypothetical protein n=1 Tax=Kitasatospora sp. NPDC056446 TaxID=3345819 RepID=UPI0036C03156